VSRKKVKEKGEKAMSLIDVLCLAIEIMTEAVKAECKGQHEAASGLMMQVKELLDQNVDLMKG